MTDILLVILLSVSVLVLICFLGSKAINKVYRDYNSALAAMEQLLKIQQDQIQLYEKRVDTQAKIIEMLEA